jgi:hypothetical protein
MPFCPRPPKSRKLRSSYLPEAPEVEEAEIVLFLT